MKFSALNLKPEILQALEEMGYEEMTPIQEESIPHILNGKDVLGLAETGSGKTSACGIPLVQRTNSSLNAIQVLILVPTRELALQYVQEIDTIARFTDIAPFAVFGGFDMSIQRAKLRHGVHILVATPGRLIDFLWNTDLVDLSQVHTVVLDEADEMLKMGFIEDIDFIMSCLIHEHETLLFSATMPAGGRPPCPLLPRKSRAHRVEQGSKGPPVAGAPLPARRQQSSPGPGRLLERGEINPGNHLLQLP